MKILFDYKIFLYQSYGGVSRYFVELTKNLIKQKMSPLIVAPLHINEHLNEFSSKNKVGKYIEPKRKIIFFYKIYNELYSTLFLKNYKHDIFHTTYYDKSLLNLKKPLIVTVYDLIHEIYYKDYKKNINFRSKKSILERADHIICISENTKNDLQNFYNIDENKISVIYLSNFVNYNPDIITKLNINKSYFLYVGMRKRYKNFKFFVDAFSRDKKLVENFDIICFGGGKFTKDELVFFSKKEINISKIHYFEGDDTLLSTLYKNAEALVYPSMYEGFGLPILEAMTSKCPVISSNTSSLPEVYGNAALSFDPTSVDDLNQKMNLIINDKNLKKKLIDLGSARAKKFTMNKLAEETISVYKKFI